ncbi:TetR family transcriptional regulator C-terminal domain-containing protein [Spiractinospora alimapuensis]|uniref:TetR/AcrR family transcriptional regulator n=1 Tax=Spiractinospora alimapuensis TaxID=2820884 RepID=UPI001F349612|nr:TetR/AcrR family transcriptional regulator [Spiractinospora alimapuensis]QVQ53490.1 TetR family transcriptional regulator C-terminal domain-containing protein [Spiractinospora alimapuensis]
MSDRATNDVRDRVRDIIQRSDELQRVFATRIGMEPSKLSKSLTGTRRFSADELVSIAEAGGVTVNWLVNGDDTATTVTATPRPSAEVTSTPVGIADDTGALREHNRRQQIIDAAWTLIAERGYHAVRVADIAKECGTSAATVHYHFPTLRDLLLEALRHSVRLAFDRQVAGLHTIVDPRERLYQLIELQLPHPGRLRLEWSIWLQVWTAAALDPTMRDLHADSYWRWHETIARTLREGQDTGVFGAFDPEQMTKRITALVDGMGIQVLAGMPGRTVTDMRQTMRDVIERDIVQE